MNRRALLSGIFAAIFVLTVVEALLFAGLFFAPVQAAGTSSVQITTYNNSTPVQGYWVELCHIYPQQPTVSYIACSSTYSNAQGITIWTLPAGTRAWYEVLGPSPTPGINLACQVSAQVWFPKTVGATSKYAAVMSCT